MGSRLRKRPVVEWFGDEIFAMILAFTYAINKKENTVIKVGTMRELYFIINPQAKNGYCLKTWKKIEQKLAELKVEYEAYFTEYKGNGKEIAESLLQKGNGLKIIVAVGGDGTLNEVVNGVKGANNVAIGFIPGGSGNDFVRGFHLPKDPMKALHYILHHKNKSPQIVDIGKVINKEGKVRCFVNNAGIGFDAHVVRKVNESKVKAFFNRFSLGKLAYVYFLIKELFTYKYNEVTVTIDGKEYHFNDVLVVTVSNHPYIGGGMKLAPFASSVDGELDVIVVHHLPKWKVLLFFMTVFWGGHLKFKSVNTFRGKEISISPKGHVYAHADGEAIDGTPFSIQVLHNTFPLIKDSIKDIAK